MTQTIMHLHKLPAAHDVQVLFQTLRGQTAAVTLSRSCLDDYDTLLLHLMHASFERDLGMGFDLNETTATAATGSYVKSSSDILIVHQGRILERNKLSFSELLKQADNQLGSRRNYDSSQNRCYDDDASIFLQLKCRVKGGMDRQNRVGSKFGGGGVSSAQQAERERKDRLKRLALESIDLAKDPYLMRNHLGTYECKLCLTLHTNEANYLAHTQGKKHQQGLARRAHMEKLRQEKEQQQQQQAGMPTHYPLQPKPKKIRIGRPAYQVFKSRDTDTNQRCLSFELQYPEIEEDLQPRHRFMSAFEQRMESPPDRRYQYLLFAAEPYETVAFKIPNEPIDRGEERFVTHWDAEDKKFTLSLYFLEEDQHQEESKTNGISGVGLTAPATVKTEG